jgi:protease-4
MIFARKVWNLLVAIKDALVLVMALLFFFLLFAALTARGPSPEVRKGALLIRLKGRWWRNCPGSIRPRC